MMLASGGVRLFGAALLNAIPVIGQIIFVGSLLIGFLGSSLKVLIKQKQVLLLYKKQIKILRII